MDFVYSRKRISLKGFAPNDWIYSKICETGSFYELDLLRYMRYALKDRKQGCILDVGANIGNHSVYFGLFIAKKVVAFEPNCDVLSVLKENLVNNHIDYKIYEVGLGDRSAVATVEISDEHANNIGGARLKLVNGHHNAVREKVVGIAKLDSLLTEIEQFSKQLEISAIKIDVEGMEPEVLRGGSGLLVKHKPDIFAEIANTEQMNGVQSVILPLGYVRTTSWAATPVWHFVHRSRINPLKHMKLHLYWLVNKGIKHQFRQSINRILVKNPKGGYTCT